MIATVSRAEVIRIILLGCVVAFCEGRERLSVDIASYFPARSTLSYVLFASAYLENASYKAELILYVI